MKNNLLIAMRMTLVTTLLFGLIYPLAVTGLAQLLFPGQANGELIQKGGKLIGSRLLGQAFSAPGYFRSRPSFAGTGYDGGSSGGSNLGPTNKILISRVQVEVARLKAENPGVPVPVDLVTASGSGLDPHITPAAAEFQVPRVARERRASEADIRAVVTRHSLGRQFGFLGEPRVNVLELNLDLDAAYPSSR
ncbi:MAG: potassium-transporting ATPase subunit KdpC [Acidipila sp.]|nr:potassium-transporting ATPase subunit KdpC [Acidipila sp.]